MNQRVSRLDFYLGLQTNSFVTIQLQMRLRGLQGTKAYTTVDHLSGHQIEDCIIALPPLPEQKRIVARVDELLGLCDELEERQRDASGAHERLTASALSALSRSSTAAQIGKSWKFVAQYFDGLFTTLDSVDLLKQVILDLAVRGFLVPQNPDDEPAGELLERVTAEKQRRTFAGHSRNLPAQLGPPTEVTSGALPRGWQWAAFGDVALDIATGPFGSLIHKSDYVDDGVPLVNPSHMIDGRIVADLTVTLSPERAAELEPYRLNAGDIVMARRGEAGRAALVTEAEQGWLCGTGSFVVRFVPEMDRGYVQLVLASRDCRRFLAGEAVGSTMSNLNHGILKRLPFPVPPLAEQERVVTRMDALMTMCDQLRDRIASAAIAQEHVATALARVNSTRM